MLLVVGCGLKYSTEMMRHTLFPEFIVYVHVPSARETQVSVMEDYFQIHCPFPIGMCTEACHHFLRYCMVAPIVSGSAITFPGFTSIHLRLLRNTYTMNCLIKLYNACAAKYVYIAESFNRIHRILFSFNSN